MHDIRWIRDNAAAFDAGLMRRGLPADSARLIGLDEARREAIALMQEAQTKRNSLSKEIGQAMGAKDTARAEALKAEVNALKESAPEFERRERAAIEALNGALAAIPNLPLPEVPEGADEHGNVEYRRHGQKPEEGGRLHGVNAPKEHFEIGEALGLMDFEAAAKLSGSRFVVLKSGIARLERAIGQFFLNTHTAPANGELHGYTEVAPPLLVRDDAMFGTAQLPKFRDDQFGFRRSIDKSEKEKVITQLKHETGPADEYGDSRYFEDIGDGITSKMVLSDLGEKRCDELIGMMWLIPTAEVPLTNLVREAITAEEELPLRFVALTPCFRAEAGSAGRDTRGMLRQHQFNKVELVSITTPEASRAEHERMLANAEHVLKALDLHYRVMTLCTGDMGFASQKTYDIEVWLPGQKAYREISSCSVCGDFQARRMNARFRPKGEKETRFVHTLNGSGVAVGRALIAVLENYQNADGSVTIPEALRPYMGGAAKIEKAG